MVTSHPDGVSGCPWGTVRASTERTMHCEPKRSLSSLSSSGRAIAAVLTLTLSAPAAVRLTTSSIVPRSDVEAVTSRKVSSSAP
ncbi:Uncharacterised protein [Mycobacteroides abscessus subsp. abscessus]|nr:Uncharacterised protein [Mycobacteroides abscessus subsp. abscessus]